MRARLPVLALIGALLPLASSCGRSDSRAAKAEDGITVEIATTPPAKSAASPARPAAAAPAPKLPLIVPLTKEQPAPIPKPEAAKPKRTPPPPAVRAAPGEVASASTPSKAGDSGDTPIHPANLPLPNPVVARTIERIGYPCGQVTSSSAVPGAGGPAYKVTCSSGASYRASTVAGHLRFRKWEKE